MRVHGRWRSSKSWAVVVVALFAGCGATTPRPPLAEPTPRPARQMDAGPGDAGPPDAGLVAVAVLEQSARPGAAEPRFRTFRSDIACTRDTDCRIGSPPTCNECGSCPAVIDARVPLPSLRCPPRRRGAAPPTCSDCPPAPDYAVCSEGRCAGGSDPPALDQRHACARDSDCVAVWSGGCCGCANAVLALSRTALAEVRTFCEQMPCSTEAAASRHRLGPACGVRTPTDESTYRASCAHELCTIARLPD